VSNSIIRPSARVLAAVGIAIATSQAIGQESAELEEVSITGSRIQQTGMTTPTPVASLSSAELTDMAPGTVMEGLSQLPQFYGSASVSNFNAPGYSFFTSAGGGSLNLRGVGTKRTLTLLNGRRVVASSIYGGPDVNLFPESVLKTVETVTGGASAAYGTDAVSGVANFVLDTKFSGIRGHVQRGQTSRGDNDNAEGSITLGRDLGARSHILFSAEHFEQDPVESFAGRDWYQGWGLVQNTASGAGSSQANPKFLKVPRVMSTVASYDGVVTAWQALAGSTVPASFTRSIFGSDGSLSPFQLGNPYSTTGTSAQSVLGGGSGTDNNTDRPSLQPRSSRSSAFLYLDSDLTDNTNVYLQGLYGKQTIKATNNGGILQAGAGQPLTIFANNAFLPAALRSQMAASNIASFTMGRIGHSSDLAGNAYVEQDTKTVSGTVGFKSAISSGRFDGWTVEGYYQYGKSDITAAQIGGIRLDRLFMAVDAVTDPATGRTVCNVTLTSGQYQDCVPLNLFGRGNASKAALDWVTGFDPGIRVSTTPYLPGYPAETYSYVGGENKLRLIDLKQHVGELVASGEVWEGFGAGAVAMAFGAHYRRESVDQKVQASQGNPAADPFFFPVPKNNAALGIRGVPGGAANNSVEFQFSKVPFIRGAFDVKELFTEAQVPLLSGKPMLQQLNFNGAVRWAEYGGSGTIWSYKGGLDAEVDDQFRLRGTYSRDVRAANLGERFDRTGGVANITDYGAAGNPAYSVTIVQGGNPNVAPEKADTYTVGAVYRPQWLEGLDLSVDWLSVSLQGSIESFTAQQIVDACYRQGNQDQCAFIDRSGPNNTIFIVNQTVQNVSKAKISGVDFEVGYARPVEWLGGGERIGTRLFASWLDENSTTSSTGVKTDRAGETGNLALPEWKVTAQVNYTRGPVRAFVQARYIDSGKLNTSNNLNGVWDVADNTVASATYVDTRLSYTMNVGDGTVEWYANVNNLFDRAPPVAASYSAFSASPAQYNASLFDVLGRRFVVGVKADF
jgi:iron complex outermembrane recepter protein